MLRINEYAQNRNHNANARELQRHAQQQRMAQEITEQNAPNKGINNRVIAIASVTISIASAILVGGTS